jgi:hypothetical protein
MAAPTARTGIDVNAAPKSELAKPGPFFQFIVVGLEASVAQLVERHLAKVNVESSNLFARSIFCTSPDLSLQRSD